MSNLPKFNLAKNSLKTDDELKDALKGTQRAEEKFFKPGKHEVTVVSSTYMGLASDQRWGKFFVVYEGTGGKQIRDCILVPYEDVKFVGASGKETMLPFKRTKDLLEAFGNKVTVSSLEKTLAMYFSKDNDCVGLNVAIEVGYEGNHVDYVGKDDSGASTYAILARNGDRIKDLPTFSDYPSANAYAETKNIAIERFANIVKYAQSATPAAKKKANEGW